MRPAVFVTLFVFLTLLGGGCSAPEPPISDDIWVGTITTEGNVTTVVNESGSVWGGTARLVEEASIGVEAGPEEYMLGSVGGVYATEERIYVVDGQVPTVRVYDRAGNHVGELGRQGQGPGEYTRPSLITGDNAGRIFVQDSRGRRFNVFAESGESIDTWPAGDAMCCAYPMVAAANGNLWARRRVRGDPEERPSYYGLQLFGPEGPIGEIRWPVEAEFEAVETTAMTRFAGRRGLPVPFSPRSTWVIAPAGTIVTGASDRYRFEMQSEAGAVIAVERYWVPVSITPQEAEWQRRLFVVIARMETVSEEWTWDGAEMPATKPAFSSFIPAASGEIWVRRPGPGELLSDCAENPIEAGWEASSQAPCWRDSTIIDVFDAEGRFLGEVETPPRLRAFPSVLHIRGAQVVGVVEDALGTIMVKRYRLVLPEEEER